ncbi:hypothetical protein [Streptomyces sp. NPDC046984]|uniref:hypothetical protein n=1 Tax=unclassified Streptomyces TaxID=2593676 RepID=UPI0033D61F0C
MVDVYGAFQRWAVAETLQTSTERLIAEAAARGQADVDLVSVDATSRAPTTTQPGSTSLLPMARQSSRSGERTSPVRLLSAGVVSPSSA